MIDLHTHILPGVDDGLNTEDEAVEFARVAQEDGVRTIVATPHCNASEFASQFSAPLQPLHLSVALDPQFTVGSLSRRSVSSDFCDICAAVWD